MAPLTRLQEMLTVKSDDVAGRTKVYEASFAVMTIRSKRAFRNPSTFWSRKCARWALSRLEFKLN